MYKGQFRTDTFDPDKNIVNMENWVQPTIFNTGDCTLYLNGIAIEPGDAFIIGANGVEMNGMLQLRFLENGVKPEAKINYVLLSNKCCDPCRATNISQQGGNAGNRQEGTGTASPSEHSKLPQTGQTANQGTLHLLDSKQRNLVSDTATIETNKGKNGQTQKIGNPAFKS